MARHLTQRRNTPTDGRHLDPNLLASVLREIINKGRSGFINDVKALTNGDRYTEEGEPLPYTLNDRGYAVMRDLFKKGY